MKVVHVIENWGISSGGVYSAISPLIESLNLSIDSVVLTNKNTTQENKYIEEFKGYFWGIHLNKTLLSILMKHKPDVIHIHGLWTPKSLLCFIYARLARKKIIISPHGMLAHRAFSKSMLKKLCVYYLYERMVLKSAHVIHLLNEAENSDSSRFLKAKKIAIVPNPAVLDQSKLIKKPYEDKKSILFLGRISKLKGILELINGWIKVKDEQGYENCVLDIVGWGSDYEEISKLHFISDRSNRIYIHPPVFDYKKTELLMNAKLFVLPSFTEGLPMAALEAIACKTPVMVSKYCNLNILERVNGFEYVEPTPESIALWLKRFIKINPLEIHRIAEEAYEIVMKNYALEKITNLYLEMYENA